MDPTNRAELDPRSGAQQTRGQWDNPALGGQGKWEHRARGHPHSSLLIIRPSLFMTSSINALFCFLGDTDRPTSEAYAQQARSGRAGYDEGTGAAGLGKQPLDELGQSSVGTGVSGRYDTSGQQGGQERFTSDRATREDPTSGSAWQGDADNDTLLVGNPSLGGKVKGTSLLSFVVLVEL